MASGLVSESTAGRPTITKSLTAVGTWTAVPSPGGEKSGGARVGVGVWEGWGLVVCVVCGFVVL